MKRKIRLFGENIVPRCEYCKNCVTKKDGFVCNANKVMKNGKCRKYQYNPIMRTPVSTEKALPNYKPEDFEV